MRATFDIKDFKKVYATLVDTLGCDQEAFLTDDVIELERKDFEKLKELLPEVFFIVDENSFSMREKLLMAAEALGWTCYEEYDSDGVDFRKSSPAGEDFGFYVHNGDDIVQEAVDYALNFDTEEHISMWLGAKRNGGSGIPSPRELVRDADDIQDMLEELADAFVAVRDGRDPNEPKKSIKKIVAEGNGCTKILVVVKDGLVQEVYCSDPNAEVCIDDLDGDDRDDDEDHHWLDDTIIDKSKMTLLY